jgi:cytochrome c-type biogenesis protein CcmH/NrfG
LLWDTNSDGRIFEGKPGGKSPPPGIPFKAFCTFMLYRATRPSLALACLMIAFPVFAQRDRDTFTPGPSFEISGQVHTDNGPARNVAVRLERFGGGIIDQMTTDNGGRFRFAGMVRGYYTVVVEAPGFRVARQTADLQVLFKTFLMFELAWDTASLPSDGFPNVIDLRVPGPARVEYAKARSALVAKKADDAIRHLKQAVFIYPDFFEAQLMLGTSYMDGREWAKAEEALNRALELKPDSAPPLLSLGEVYWRQKRYAEAERTLLQGLKLDDKSWHGYFTLARLYWDLENISKAGPAIGRTLQLKPDFAEAHLLAGNILLRINQQERALAAYQDYLRLEPKGEFAAQARELVQKLSKAIVDRQNRER